MNNQLRRTAAQKPVIENPASQASPPFHQIFGSGFATGRVHPITGPAFLRPLEAQAAHCEYFPDECIEIHTPDDHVPPESARRKIRIPRVPPNRINHRFIDPGDLPFVSGFPIEEPVTGNATAREQFHRFMLDDLMIACRASMMAEEIVSRRGEQVLEMDKHGSRLLDEEEIGIVQGFQRHECSSSA
jgi:hypothetical protein